MLKKLSCFFLILLLFASNSVSAQGYVYENREQAVSIVFPDGWLIDKERPSNLILAVSRTPEGESINLAVEKLPRQYRSFTFKDFSPQDLQDYVAELEKKLSSVNPDVKVEGWGTKYIDNQKAIWVVLSMSSKTSTENINMKMLHVQVMHNANLYMVTCGATKEKYRRFKAVFEQAVNSLKIGMPWATL